MTLTTPWWLLLIAMATGFLIGSINPATLLARARGINLREVGSGNPGATNTARAMGVKTGVLVGVLDILKGLLPTLFFSIWGPAAGELAGLSAVLGHIYSPFLKGQGGKGAATSLGTILGVQAAWVLPMLAAFGVVVGLTRRVGLGAVAGALVLIGCGIWWSDSWDESLFAWILAFVVLMRHRGNIAAAAADVKSHLGKKPD